MKRIDWDAMQTLGRLGNVTIMSGEAKTLSDEEVNQINANLRAALLEIEKAVGLLSLAKERYAAKVFPSARQPHQTPLPADKGMTEEQVRDAHEAYLHTLANDL